MNQDKNKALTQFGSRFTQSPTKSRLNSFSMSGGGFKERMIFRGLHLPT